MGNIVAIAKDLLRSPAQVVALDDLVAEQVDLLLESMDRRHFPMDTRPVDGKTVKARIDAYVEAASNLATLAALLGRWGPVEAHPSLARIFTQIGDASETEGGVYAWHALGWLPFVAIQYSASIAAVSGQRFDAVAAMYGARVGKPSRPEDPMGAVERATARTVEWRADDAFKHLPELARQKTPMSDYLLAHVQRQLGGVIAIRSEFEAVFDCFEVINVLTVYSRGSEGRRAHVPVGRFLWKAASYGGGPLAAMKADAQSQGDGWPPARAGLFGGAPGRFVELADRYLAEYGGRLGW